MDVDSLQPLGTPVWIELPVPDPPRAREFYGATLDWLFDVVEEGRYAYCLVRGRRAGGIYRSPDDRTPVQWRVDLATPDCDATAARVREAGGTVLDGPRDVFDFGRTASVRDPVGAVFGLWEGRRHPGAQVVNEPGALVRNDLVTATPEPARRFYAAVFDFTLDRNEDLPGVDFTFLRRPDGHEVGGIMGLPSAAVSAWNTTFEVAGTDEVVRRAVEAGGRCIDGPQDFVYGRIATLVDPFGAEFSVITRPAA
jgi:predicted enzyme related to lactoylglutathione lyase